MARLSRHLTLEVLQGELASMIDVKKIVLVSPLEQNKTVVAWDGKPHKRYFELEAI